MSTVGVAKAKAHFLSLVNQVAANRQAVTLTRKGKSLAQIVPMPEVEGEDPLAIYRIGGVTILGDILEPANDPDDWEYD